MAFDGFILNAVVTELKRNLINGKVQKIYEPNSNEILLGIYANGLQYTLSLNVSSNFYSAYLTTTKKENPLAAPNFCMLLRKHLMGYRISNIFTMQFERIMIIELSGNDENHEPAVKKLVVELMGKHSNILLLNNNHIIIDALKHFSVTNGANRNIIPRCEYVFPASNKIDISLYANLENNLDENDTLSNFFINNFIGLSKTLVEHAISSLNIENVLNNSNFNTLANYLLNLKECISLEQVKCSFVNENEYTILPANENVPLQVNTFLDDYYSEKQSTQQFLTYRNQLLSFISSKLKKISKKLSTIDDKIKECVHMDDYRLYGELITNYLYQIPKAHVSSITLTNYYNNELVTVPLDISLSPAANAKKYFKKYHKLKNACSIVQEQKQELEKEINYFESIVYEIQSAQIIKDLDEIYDEIQDTFTSRQKQIKKKHVKKIGVKKDNKFIEPLTYILDNFHILVGKNNKQNDELTFKIASKEDLWFHVKDFHGSHVVLVTGGKVPSQEIINQCASIAAYYSKANQSSNVPVDYTTVKYVKKPNNVKPGMVIYTNQETVNVNPKLP